MRTDGIGGFVVAPGALFFAQRKALAALAIEHRLASITARREYAEAGCLMAYGSPIRDNYLQAADYVSQILRGAEAGRASVRAEPAKFDFVINLKSAARRSASRCRRRCSPAPKRFSQRRDDPQPRGLRSTTQSPPPL